MHRCIELKSESIFRLWSKEFVLLKASWENTGREL